MRALTALIAGLIFGLGLIVSGMADPARVLGFLNVAGGHWDPSLAFVMGGALAVTLPAYAWARRRRASLLACKFDLPTKTRIDRPLLAGSALFGLGWGLAGFCPGPAVVALGQGLPKAVLFVAAMLAGMALVEWLTRRTIR